MALKPRTKAFADELIAQPLQEKNQTEAYIKTHKTTNRRAAGVEASKLLAKPNVQIYMQEHVDNAKRAMVEIAMDEATKTGDRIKALQDIIDRNEGKPTQKQITQNTNLNVNVEASKELADEFTEFMRQSTVRKTPAKA